MKKGFVANIEKATLENTDFRRVLYTGKFSQLVLMCLKPGEEIGAEVHEDVDQFFRFEKGEGTVVIDGVSHPVRDGSAVIVPNGANHNVLNTSSTEDLINDEISVFVANNCEHPSLFWFPGRARLNLGSRVGLGMRGSRDRGCFLKPGPA
ncbi:MAG: cupin domain-containing protein [Candidatus Methanoculleus thermohydrogenotrophicum]|nr:cupin domain-containing protein [Candidatus Methanoculleus thermohydrogenotrophicum]